MKLFFREAGNGPPIIILHGLMGASDNWLTIAKQLSATNKVYSLDLRNHGRSPHSSDFDYAALSGDVREFIEDEEIQQPVLIGHSMGGKVAMTLALQYPLKIRKLVVVDIAPKKYKSGYFDALIGQLLALNVDQIRSRNEADMWLSSGIPEVGVRRFLLKNLVRGESGGFNWRPNLSVIHQSLPTITEGVAGQGVFEKPSLFIRGGKSKYIPDEDFENIKALFPASEFVTIENAGHWVHAEAPAAFLAAVSEFVRDV